MNTKNTSVYLNNVALLSAYTEFKNILSDAFENIAENFDTNKPYQLTNQKEKEYFIYIYQQTNIDKKAQKDYQKKHYINEKNQLTQFLSQHTIIYSTKKDLNSYGIIAFGHKKNRDNFYIYSKNIIKCYSDIESYFSGSKVPKKYQDLMRIFYEQYKLNKINQNNIQKQKKAKI